MNEPNEDIINMDRAELKRLAKNRLRQPQVRSVLMFASLIIFLIMGIFFIYLFSQMMANISPTATSATIMKQYANSDQQTEAWSWMSNFSTMFFIAGLNFTALDLVRNKDAKVGFGQTLLRVFNSRYFWLVLGSQILMRLAISVGTMLLIVPGIMLQYGLMLVPFVLYDSREHQSHVDLFKVLADSYRITRGHKFDLFVLQLSFLGWYLLGFFTLGVAFIWIYPYTQLTLAAYYEQLRLRYEAAHPQAD